MQKGKLHSNEIFLQGEVYKKNCPANQAGRFWFIINEKLLLVIIVPPGIERLYVVGVIFPYYRFVIFFLTIRIGHGHYKKPAVKPFFIRRFTANM